MHHDDTAPTAPKTSKTPKKAVRPTKTPKSAPGVAKRVSGKKGTKKLTAKGTPRQRREQGTGRAPRSRPKKPPHLIVKDAQTARVRRSAVREEEVGEAQIPRGQTILLGEMAEFINRHFEEKLNEFTPYDWWRRHKIGTLSTPLPKPVRMIGTGPLFLAADIVKWYKNYVANKGRWGTGA